MKSTAKDVILLCKGWYDKNKYETILDALKEYYRKNYTNNLEDCLNEKFILRIILIEVMREIATCYSDRLIYFVNQYLIYGKTIYMPNPENIEYDHQLFYRITNFLANLNMHSDKLTNIDTSDYFQYKTNEHGIQERILKENII